MVRIRIRTEEQILEKTGNFEGEIIYQRSDRIQERFVYDRLKS